MIFNDIYLSPVPHGIPEDHSDATSLPTDPQNSFDLGDGPILLGPHGRNVLHRLTENRLVHPTTTDHDRGQLEDCHAFFYKCMGDEGIFHALRTSGPDRTAIYCTGTT